MKEFDMNAFNFNFLLLEYAKDLKISEVEIAVILMIDHLLKQEPKTLITPDALSLKLLAPLDTIDNILISLNHRSLITYVREKKSMYTSLHPLHILLRERAINTILNSDKMEADQELSKALENIYAIFERELARPLSTVEVNQIYNWVKKYGKDELIDSIGETKETRKQKISIKNVDKTLFDRAIKKDRKSEGRSTLSKEHDYTLEEAAKKAKKDWSND